MTDLGLSIQGSSRIWARDINEDTQSPQTSVYREAVTYSSLYFSNHVCKTAASSLCRTFITEGAAWVSEPCSDTGMVGKYFPWLIISTIWFAVEVLTYLINHHVLYAVASFIFAYEQWLIYRREIMLINFTAIKLLCCTENRCCKVSSYSTTVRQTQHFVQWYFIVCLVSNVI